MFGLGFTEIIALLVLALLVIGPKQLPELARNLGRFFNELKRTTNMFKDEFKSSMQDQIRPPPYQPPPPPPVSVSEDESIQSQPHEPGPDFYYGEPASYEKEENTISTPVSGKKEPGSDDKS